MIPEAFPESATLTPTEFTAWRAKHHPGLPRPRQGRAAHIIASVLDIRLGIAHSLAVRYYGGTYYIERT